jgi:hypothetical protein
MMCRFYPREVSVNRAEAKASLFEYIDVFYNRVRFHSSLGGRSPAEHEKALSSLTGCPDSLGRFNPAYFPKTFSFSSGSWKASATRVM